MMQKYDGLTKTRKEIVRGIKESLSDVQNDEENRKMIEGAKEFSRTIRGMRDHIADLEERLVRLEGMHPDTGGKRYIRG